MSPKTYTKQTNEFKHCISIVDLFFLNQEEIRKGYLLGLSGGTEPVGSDTSRAYWIGWLNGAVDGEHIKITPEQVFLSRQYALGAAVTEVYNQQGLSIPCVIPTTIQ